ncbi:MAG: sigma-70 family RNA polymerase sigma factor [Ruminococcus sp.]|nr:sigma-70 family RNA polymerase sigma factor [Ruminococcus sp.]
MKELGEPDSIIIIQKYYYERNAKEIGRLIGMNAAAVRMRCTRAIKKLRSLLSDID